MLLTALALAAPLTAMAAAIPVKLYKNPNCYCCDLYAKHLAENGFKVELINTTDMASIKQQYNVPEKLEGCHTALVGGYVVEGLVPAQFVQRMLKEHPPIRGVALPGMPVGAPGMPGVKPAPLTIYTLDSSSPPKVFASF
ncbi:DUF411 domain-containing protein [Cupriavidus sp. SK-3]|uniref:DUF411 domain-containing protein n=1 Tax=Cupriavidus sp. SK-3 TaxID=1470558 RepID=UPI000A9B99C9|nr:DUF411 domain-containing protein [Cupriavidus sp. SK-3]